MSELSTIILRFRDLVTDRGDTIRRHQSIVDEIVGGKKRGYVWWGWWHKLGEAIPVDAFVELSDRADDGGLNLYLMDSGQEKLYRARCTAIDWDSKLKAFTLEESEATPEYYKEKKILAWFKLTGFEEVADPESVLHQFSYLQVDDFFESKQSRYTPFYDKQVSSLHELQHQNRTIWFVRPYKTGDKTHEVSLLDSRSITPVDFAPEYFESDSRTLLWVSDLHFSVDG